MTRDITIAVFVVHGEKVLLHKHKKLGIWLPLGGHIEPNELPEEAVVREAKEESGLDIEIADTETESQPGGEGVRFLKRPEHLLLEDIVPGHQHIDMIYYALCDTFLISPPDGESKEIKWFKAEELDDLGAPANVSVLAKEALLKLGKNT